MPKTVLIVEDNIVHATLIRDLLEAGGLNVECAKNSTEAMGLARDRGPDLVIMDIQLPGISGIEVTKAIKADDDLKDVPVIAVTAFASKKDGVKIRNAGCSEVLAKPFTITGLLDTVAKFL